MRLTKLWLRKQIRGAEAKAQQEINDNASGGRIAAGLASEGYAGGYRDALSDVLLLLNGVKPNRRHYWYDEA